MEDHTPPHHDGPPNGSGFEGLLREEINAVSCVTGFAVPPG